MPKNQLKIRRQQRTIKITQLITVLGLLIFNGIHSAYAQSVQPMVFELEPVGNRSSVDLKIENTKSSPITYEINAVKIKHDEFGNETRTSGEDDFLIYPPQTLILPGKTQIIKVRYVGEPQLELSQTYRILANELPVDLSGGDSSGVSVAMNFSTLCNVTPPGSKPEISVTRLEKAEGENWSITIANDGTRFVRLTETVIEVASTGDAKNKKVFKNEYISDLFSKNLVAPKSTLTLTIPAIEGFDLATTKITISES